MLTPPPHFVRHGTIIHAEPCIEFSGQFDNNGDPVLITRLVPRSFPVIRPVPGHEFEGQFVAQVSHERPYLILETPTIGLAFQLDNLPPIAFGGDSKPLLRMKGATIGERDGIRQTSWIVHCKSADQDWGLLTPGIAEKAENLPGQSENPTTKILQGRIASEMLWLEIERDRIAQERDERYTIETGKKTAKLKVLGEAYQKALVTQHYNHVEFMTWQDQIEYGRKHPENVRPEVLQKSYARAHSAYHRARARVREFEIASDHPKLKPMIDDLAKSYLTRYQAIQNRKTELIRLEETVLKNSPRLKEDAAPDINICLTSPARELEYELSKSKSVHVSRYRQALQPSKPVTRRGIKA